MTGFIPSDLHDLLYDLGEAILPVGQLDPSLTLRQMKIVDALDRLILSEDASTEERWLTLAADPWAKHPIGRKNVSQWREDRGLDGVNVRFAMNSWNWPTVAEPDPLYSPFEKPEPPSAPGALWATRAALYGDSWEALRQVAKAAGSPVPWPQLLPQFLDASVAGWPSGAPPAPRFIRTLGRDLVIVTTSLKPGVASPLSETFLSALGEMRRPGNRYSRADVDRARALMMAAVRNVSA